MWGVQSIMHLLMFNTWASDQFADFVQCGGLDAYFSVCKTEFCSLAVLVSRTLNYVDLCTSNEHCSFNGNLIWVRFIKDNPSESCICGEILAAWVFDWAVQDEESVPLTTAGDALLALQLSYISVEIQWEIKINYFCCCRGQKDGNCKLCHMCCRIEHTVIKLIALI